jgi:hypothetical protein
MDPKCLAAFKVGRTEKKSHPTTMVAANGDDGTGACAAGPRRVGEGGECSCTAPQPERESSGRHHGKEQGMLGVGWECWMHEITCAMAVISAACVTCL